MIIYGAMEKWQGFLKILRKEMILQLIKTWCEVEPEFTKVLRKAPSAALKSANF